MNGNILRWAAAALLLLAGCSSESAEPAPLVLAASSLQESLTEAADSWAAKGKERPVISFAASSALARQIESGAKADIFISADEAWMDRLGRARRIRRETRRNLLSNSLVLIAPQGGPRSLPLEPKPLLAALGDGRLAMADPDGVPAGTYGMAALRSMRLWDELSGRIARGESVRAALALVERGEAPLGIVYATDARASKKVWVVAAIPAQSHPPIVYPVALLAGEAGVTAEQFYRFLLSDEGQAIFLRHGFARPGR